jgi:hypothetical protein
MSKYKKFYSVGLNFFSKLDIFLDIFIFTHYGLKNNYKIKMSRNHLSSQNNSQRKSREK